MLDLSRSQFTEVIERAVATGFTVDEEGLALVAVQTGAVEEVKPGTGASSDIFVGFSTGDTPTKGYKNAVEEYTIPADSPYTVQLHVNIVATQIQIYDDSTSVYLTENVGVADGQYSVNDTTGVATFNVAQAGDSITVFYRYALTVIEARQLYFQNHINADACQEAARTGVIRGSGELWTDEWTPAVQWALTDTPLIAASGLITNTGTGVAVGRVISIPSATDPFLGIAFNLA